MQLRLPLVKSSDSRWIETVMKDFNTFLQDHANCERKASAFAMSLVAKYPDRTEILPDLIDTALEEMEHFREVYEVMRQRSVLLKHEITEDLYIKKLLQQLRSGREERFLDRLLLGSVIESRGAERFKLVYEALSEIELKKFYHKLWASEAKHGDIFVRMALNYFSETDVFNRLNDLNEKEGEIISSLPFTAALH
ncbi:MAG: tRNA-(ms[2]io[6]A)-hydroxylase [Bacteroidota bacterium]|jgi:tRNA-(ms[2]io[6]A)-hydroxylase